MFSFVAGMYVEEFGGEMLNITEVKSMWDIVMWLNMKM